MLFSIVTVTCPGTFGGSDMVEGGAGAMGRLGMVGFGGGCKQKSTGDTSIALLLSCTPRSQHKSNLESGRHDETGIICSPVSGTASLHNYWRFLQYRGRSAQTRLNVSLSPTSSTKQNWAYSPDLYCSHYILVFHTVGQKQTELSVTKT